MPRSGPRRPLVAVRMTVEEIQALDKIAATWTREEGIKVTRSDVVRVAVARYLEGRKVKVP